MAGDLPDAREGQTGVSLLEEELRTAREYDRWIGRPGFVSAGMRLLLGPAGQFLVNTPAFRLPEEVRLKPADRVLEVGCGRAALLRILAARVGFLTPPVGLDVSRTMLRMAGRDLRRDDGPAVELVAGAATVLPFADEQFDYVISAHMVKHLSDAALLLCLREMRRVLRPGGLALVWDIAPVHSRTVDRWNRWLITRGVSSAHLRSYRQLAALAKRAGFDWCGNAGLRPFLYPPIPRTSIIMGKAPAGWQP
jgi:SAM-dependent methyltransferase